MDWKKYQDLAMATALSAGVKILAALGIYVIGRWLISLLMSLVARTLRSHKIDPTLMAYLVSIINVVLNMALALALLGFFGVETTSFAALLAGAGLAIGTAWGGLLSHFAAGVFMLVLRPFKVGDFIEAGGITGTVQEMGLFACTILTPDNVVTYVGNGKIFADNIKNFSASAYRRVDLTAQLHHSVDPLEAISRLAPRIASIPNVVAQPAPDIAILDFNSRGTQLVVRPYAPNAHYWEVYFQTNRTIREVFTEAGYPVPEEYSAERGRD